MTSTIRQLWRENRVLVTGFVLALAVMAFFAVRTVMFWIYWADPAHRNQVIEPWMTPRYIAHSWHVPPHVVGEAMGLTPGGPRITVAEVAAQQGSSVEALVARVMAAILAHKAAQETAGPGR